MQNDGMIFFTATCKDWKPLLQKNERKEIVLDSLKFLVDDNRIWLYGYVIMHNHIHLLWRKQDPWVKKDIQQMFLKYTAQQIKFEIVSSEPKELLAYRSTQKDREFHFWNRRPYKAQMYNRKVAFQKLGYIHDNPVKAGYCNSSIDYQYSSARYYELNDSEMDFITHYEEHLGI